MRRNIIALAIISLAAVGMPAVAAAGPWQAGAKIRFILVEGENVGSRVYVEFSGVSNTEGCAGDWTVANRIYGDTAKGKHFLSLLTAAKLADRPVRVMQQGCDDLGRPIVYGIMLE